MDFNHFYCINRKKYAPVLQSMLHLTAPFLAACLSVTSYFVNIPAAHAQSMFVCLQEDGSPEYTNSKKGANCQAANLPKISVIEGDKRLFNGGGYGSPSTSARKNTSNEPSMATPKPGNKPFKLAQDDSAKASAIPAPTPSSTVSNLPKDQERKLILQNELNLKKRNLAELEKTYNNGQPERLGDEKNYQKYLDRVEGLKKDMIRTQGDIQAITREMGM